MKIDYMIHIKTRLIDFVNEERQHNRLSDIIANDIIERISAEPSIYYYSFENVKFALVKEWIMRLSLKRAVMSSEIVIRKYYDEMRDDEMVQRELIKRCSRR